MDPITHTFVGASLSAAGLRRATALATPALILAANAPDIDVVAHAWGPQAALAWRRGITHGIPALLILPFAIAGGVIAWDRWIRLRASPQLQPARPLHLLGLATIGVWSHPVLDWLNTYGMRWWMPFSSEWSYGDAVFIVDPWLWLLLGGALAVGSSAGRTAMLGWLLLAGAGTLVVLGTGVVPTWVKATWLLGVAGWIGLRLRLGPNPPRERTERVARRACVAAALFVAAMVAQTWGAERVTLAAAAELGVPPVEEIMVGPVPADPFRREVILRTAGEYHVGTFSWLERPRLVLRPDPIVNHSPDPVVRAAVSHPDAVRYLVWSRFPLYSVSDRDRGWSVRIEDVRYGSRAAAGALSGLTVLVDPELTPRRAHE